MPTSAPGAFSRRGFTLVELLVVVLIMGLSAGLVGALLRPDDRGILRVEAERLAELLDLAAIEARYTGLSIAWIADAGGYRFWRLRDDAGWYEAGTDALRDPLRARSLPRGMAISDLRIEAAEAPGGMRLEFGPHGSLAFDFQMSLGASRYAVAASPLGEVRIHAAP
jgi:general secretion pathway protein H